MTGEHALRTAKQYAAKWQIHSFQSGGAATATVGEMREVILRATHCERISFTGGGDMWRVEKAWGFDILESNQIVFIRSLGDIAHLIQ